MGKCQEYVYFTALRVLSIVGIIAALLLLICTYIVSTLLLNPSVYIHANDGYIDLRTYDISQMKPVYLNGEWTYYEDVYMPAETFDRSLLKNPRTINLPIGSITESSGTATYCISLALPSFDDNLMLYIPYSGNDLNIFVNGILQKTATLNENWINNKLFASLFHISGFDPLLDTQEILISVNKNPHDTELYKRPVILSTLQNIVTLHFVNMGIEMMIMGVLVLLMISGLIFMCFRPGHKMITYLTLFDTALIIRIIFNMSTMQSFFESIYPQFMLSDRFCLSVQIFILMFAGLIGMRLSHFLYDSESKTPKWLTIPPLCGYILCALVFSFNLELFDSIGIHCMLILYIYTMISVIYQCFLCLKKIRSAYYIAQIVKTMYAGILIFIDIFYMNSAFNFMILVYLYSIFFVVHLVIRLYDNNNSYRDVELLNQNLENIVIKRTEELSQANKILSELSVRDPLTNAFNRMYFERAAEKYVLSFNSHTEKLHLCMFDLDHFKLINDTYGHDVGDDQLCYTVSCVSKIIPADCLFARIGGEEFILLYHNTSDEDVLHNVEAIRQALEDDALKNKERTTASFGLVRFTEQISLREFLKTADLCLYQAKNKGRNKIVFNFSTTLDIFDAHCIKFCDSVY